jgi:hypothetical protein
MAFDERKRSPMTDTRRTQSSEPDGSAYGTHRQSAPTGWVGWIMFAGIMMIMLGTFQAIEGLVAIFKDDYFLVGRNGLALSVDYTAWGWTHLILGILVAAAGLGVMVGQMWARVVGIVVALVSAIVNLAFIAAYPVWGAIIITVDILVIYALTVHGKETKASEYTDYA